AHDSGAGVAGHPRSGRCATGTGRGARRRERPGVRRARGGRQPMIPAAFEYERASSVDEAIRLLGEGGEDAKLLAGGHSLLPLMKLRLARPSLLVDIGRLSDLSYVRDAGEHVAIGALTRHQDVADSDVLRDNCPIVAPAAG